MSTALGARPGVAGARRNVPVLGATSGVLNLAVLSWSPIIPILLERRGAPAFGVVVTYALVNLLGAIMQYLGGRLADRHGAKRLIALPTTFAGLLWVVMAFTQGWQAMAALYVLINIIFGIQSPSFTTLIADSVAPAERVQAFNLYQFIISPAYVAGPILGALVVLPFVPPAVFIAGTGACYVAMGLTRLRWFVEPRADLGAARSRAPGGLAAEARAAWASIIGTPARRRLLLVTVGVTAVLALTVNGPFLSLVGHRSDGLSERSIELLFGVGAVGMVAASLFTAAIARRIGDGPALAAGLVVHGLAAAAFALRLGLVGALVLFVVLYAGFQTGSVAFGSRRSAWAAGRDAGAAIGGASAVAGIAVFLVLSLAGALQGLLGRGAPLLLAAALAFATAVVALRRDPIEAAMPGRVGPPRPVMASRS